MASISDFRVRSSVVTLGGLPFRVDELRLEDVCAFQGWLDSRWAEGFAAVEPLLDLDYVPPEHRNLFAEVLPRLPDGPPAWDERRAMEAMATMEGLFVFLLTVLGRHHPELTGEQVGEIVLALDRDGYREYPALYRAVHRVSPARHFEHSYERLTGTAGPAGDDGGSARPEWGEWIDHVARTHQGWTYEHILGLTLTQFGVALNEGKTPEAGGRVWRGEDVGAIRRRRAAWLAGEDAGDG